MKEWRTLDGIEMQVEKDVAHLQFEVAQRAFPVAVDCFLDASKAVAVATARESRVVNFVEAHSAL